MHKWSGQDNPGVFGDEIPIRLHFILPANLKIGRIMIELSL